MTEAIDPEPIPEELRPLVEAEKVGGWPPSGASERVLLRLAGTFGLGLPRGAPPEAPPRGPSASGAPSATSGPLHVASVARLATATRVLRTAAIFLTGAATGAGSYHVARRAHERPAPVATVVPAARPGASPPSEVTRPPAPVESSPVAPPAPRLHPSSPADSSITAERSLLEIARTALARGQAEGALAALRRHARQFQNGELAEEREALVVQALVGIRKYDQARERAAQFNKRFPRSLFAPVVDQALGSIP